MALLRRRAQTAQAQHVDPRDAVVLEEARRAIDQQANDLTGVRTRAGATVGYATVIGSLLAGLSLNEGRQPSVWTWVGLGALAGAVSLSVYILAPRTFGFTLDIRRMDERIDKGDGVATLLRDTSLGLADAYDSNRKMMRTLHRTYLLSQFLVITELALLLNDLSRR